MLMMPPIVSGECDDGFNLVQLGGEDCEEDICEGTKHICVPEWTEGIGHESQHSCLMYSFGSHGDISFERDMVSVTVSRWGASCEVHIFDCFSAQNDETIEISLHGRPAFVHAWCLDAVDDADQRRFRFGTIVTMLGHRGRDIDLLRMDVDGWEWYFFEQLVAWSQETLAMIHQMSFELHTRIPGTFPEVQLGSLDHAQLFALLYRLGYHFVAWLPNAIIPDIDCAEFTLLLDRSIVQQHRTARKAGNGHFDKRSSLQGDPVAVSAHACRHDQPEKRAEALLGRERLAEARAGEQGGAEPLPCAHAVRIDGEGTVPFMVCTHDPEEDIMSSLLLRSERSVIMEALQELCEEGVLSCRAGRTFVEAGAAFGYASLRMAAAGMRVHAIEPQAANADLIRAAVAANKRELGLAMDLVVHECGVGPDGEHVHVNHVEGNRAATYLCMPGQEFSAGGFAEVPTSTLSTLIGGADVHVLMLTCQGCEWEAVTELQASGTRVENIILLVPPDVEGECALRSVAAQAARQLSMAGYWLYALELRGSAGTVLSPIADLDAWLVAPLCLECEGPFLFASTRRTLYEPLPAAS